MPVAAVGLVGHVKALRHQQVEIVFGACHRDIKQPPLLFDLFRCAGREIGGYAAVNNIQNED
jgi:hypothetical protein